MLIAALSFVSLASATTLYVDRSAPGPTHDGLSWATAFLKIGDAVTASQSTGSDIWVAAGTYTQNLIVSGSARGIYGGFPAGGGPWESRDWTANETIVRGDGTNPAVKILSGLSTALFRLDGLTVTNGSPGILHTSANLVIANCKVTGNTGNKVAAMNGAGIVTGVGNVTIENNVISNNVNREPYGCGAGVYVGAGARDKTVTIRDNAITDNRLDPPASPIPYESGGGIYGDLRTIVTVQGNIIARNSAPKGGGVSGHCSAQGNTITANVGGGVAVDGTVSGNTVTDNIGGGIYGGSLVENNLVARNTGYGIQGSGTIRSNIIEDNLGSGAIVDGGSIEDNDIRRNTATTTGGGVVFTGLGYITGNRITDNVAQQGGGIYVDRAHYAFVSDNTIEGNRAIEGGGVMVSSDGLARIDRCLLRGNVADRGGALFVDTSGEADLGSSAFVANTANETGGGAQCEASANIVLVNCTFLCNSAPVGGALAIVSQYASVDLYNSIVAWNSAGVVMTEPSSYNSVRRGTNCLYGNGGLDYVNLLPEPGDILVDPLLVDPTDGDYHLSATSPCIDVGLSVVPARSGPYRYPGGTDIDGDSRVCNGLGGPVAIVDIGADEYYTGSEVMPAPPGFFGPGWTWFSIPDQPLAADARGILGFDCANRLYGWDGANQNLLLYPNDFSDLAVGPSYLTFLNVGESYTPRYEGTPVMDGLRITVHAGWNWIGLPSNHDLDLQEVYVRVGSTTTSSAGDEQQTNPWVNWNWVWWDPVERTAKITRVYKAAYPNADDNWLHPWYGYRVWVNVDEAEIIFAAR